MILVINILSFLITLSSNDEKGCICNGYSLAKDISHNSNIYIGTVIAVTGYQDYSFEIKKVYKGSLKPADRHTISQFRTSCTMRPFIKNETYMVFSRWNETSKINEVSQCSVSRRFENDPNVKVLDSIFIGKISTTKEYEKELKMIEDNFNSFLFVIHYPFTQGDTIHIKNSKTLFWDGYRFLKRNQIVESDYDRAQTMYYVMARGKDSQWLRELGIDNLIMVSHDHQQSISEYGWMNAGPTEKKFLKDLRRYMKENKIAN